MNVAEPTDLALSRGQAAVWRVLVGTSAGLSVREIARLAEVAPSRASTVVREAAERGLVLTERHRGTLICRLNREHLAADAVIALVTLRGRMLEALSSEIEAWNIPVTHASLFGSAARGDGTTSSDLDVLLVPTAAEESSSEQWASQLYDSTERIQRRTGNSPRWLVLTREEILRARRRREPLVAEIERDAITLVGSSFGQVLRLSTKSA